MNDLDLLKEDCIGKANIFDRYCYASFELLRANLFYGERINTSLEKTTKKGIEAWSILKESLERQIKSLPEKDRIFLLRDSKFLGKMYKINENIFDFEKSLETEYTKEKPYISDNLTEWFYMDIDCINKKRIKDRIEELEAKQVENTDTIEEFEYLFLTDYSVRADGYSIDNNGIVFYAGETPEDIGISPRTFNTTIYNMTYILDKYDFKKIR